jgi:hypothetical protein
MDVGPNGSIYAAGLFSSIDGVSTFKTVNKHLARLGRAVAVQARDHRC